jgi:nucleotide-binding universal stress UspA family protein
MAEPDAGVATIVVAHDGSEGAIHALEWATGLAAQIRGARLVVVHAWSPLDELGKHKPGVDMATLHTEALATLQDEWCKPVTEAGVPFEARLVEDRPIEALCRTAREVDADLLVCGTRGRGGVKGLLLGSVAKELPGKSHRPVTVVPPRA